jgi:hypothetical protein
MRFSIWIPQTLLGVLASILAGLTIAAVLWFGLFGAPSSNAQTMEAMQELSMKGLIIMIAASAGGFWRVTNSPTLFLRGPLDWSYEPSYGGGLWTTVGARGTLRTWDQEPKGGVYEAQQASPMDRHAGAPPRDRWGMQLGWQSDAGAGPTSDRVGRLRSLVHRGSLATA